MIKGWADKLEDNILKMVFGLFTAGVIAITTFYYTTNTALAQQSKDIEQVNKAIQRIDNTPELNTYKIRNLEVTNAEQKRDLKELRVDFKDFQKQYNNDREEIIKLLYEIKRK